MTASVSLREVKESDLPELFAHQQDPVANRMAAFPTRGRAAFMAHWGKILADENVMKRTILVEDEIGGNVVCFEQSGQLLLGYWIGRSFWGRGVASRAVSDFLSVVSTRPLHACVAKHNVASIRVLQKCGFSLSTDDCSGNAGEVVEEFTYTLA